MFDQIAGIVTQLEHAVHGFDPDALAPAEAKRIVEEMGRVERLAAALRTLAVKQVATSSIWRAQGDRSPERWMARVAGSSLHDAAGLLATAKALDALPGTERALRAGHLSSAQAREITEAASLAPGTESALLHTAEREGLGGLRDHARRVKIAATDGPGRAERIRQARYLSHSTDAEGAFRLELRGPMADGLALLHALRPYQEAAFDEARRAGRREPAAAHAFDGLMALAQVASCCSGQPDRGPSSAAVGLGAPSDPPDVGHAVAAARPVRRPKGSAAKVIVRIDHTALVRGHAEPGETCEIAGIGPVAASTVHEILDGGDVFLAAVVTKGVDVHSVAHLGRQVTAHQRTALEWRDAMCSNIACTNTLALEIDHRTGWAQTHDTRVDDLDRLCPSCHRQKTHHGYDLAPGSGRRPFLAPNEHRPRQLALANARGSTVEAGELAPQGR